MTILKNSEEIKNYAQNPTENTDGEMFLAMSGKETYLVIGAQSAKEAVEHIKSEAGDQAIVLESITGEKSGKRSLVKNDNSESENTGEQQRQKQDQQAPAQETHDEELAARNPDMQNRDDVDTGEEKSWLQKKILGESLEIDNDEDSSRQKKADQYEQALVNNVEEQELNADEHEKYLQAKTGELSYGSEKASGLEKTIDAFDYDHRAQVEAGDRDMTIADILNL